MSRSAFAAFGIGLLPDVRPPGAWESQPLHQPSLKIRLVGPSAVADAWSGFDTVAWEGTIDGARFVVERGRAGDHRFVHGQAPDHDGAPSEQTRAVHHLCPEGQVLCCAPSDQTDPVWWRVVLDSVLFTVALLKEYEALHAGAVVTPAGVIAITAATGGGKSTLLAELLERGLTLMADDVLILEPRGAQSPLAHPAPPLMTVPASRTPTLAEPRRAETIASIGEEAWIAVPVHSEPVPLRNFVVLNRRPGGGLSLTKIDNPLVALLNSLMKFPLTSHRERARFELASSIASTTGQWRLEADMDTTPGEIADTLLVGVL